ncbi:MAG: carbonic anhydrase [Ignavibacteriae bacterium HGW-Ignavibacteriae-1]|jgi:carbonic anhydrase|nr:MAG: carbonic anhydrase [Ignavibacteriae bacterium HGW-Ignavibacteriae-1]
MKKSYFTVLSLIFALILISCNKQDKEAENAENKDTLQTVEKVEILTPGDALAELKAGNRRFLSEKLINTNYSENIEETKSGQKPHSAILSCMDSRVPPEIIFDQGIGNIFAIRNAGNVEDENILGSMEYAVDHAGAKLIVVMGHSSCGAVTGAIHNVKLGNLTQLLAQIKPAIKSDLSHSDVINETAKNNVKMTIEDILAKSAVISELLHEKKIAIVGAFYDIATGEVQFME